jgi:hypothetical protein
MNQVLLSIKGFKSHSSSGLRFTDLLSYLFDNCVSISDYTMVLKPYDVRW